jgi:hypothetical protein
MADFALCMNAKAYSGCPVSQSAVREAAAKSVASEAQALSDKCRGLEGDLQALQQAISG